MVGRWISERASTFYARPHLFDPAFDVFVRMDRSLLHQQNLKGLDLAVVVIRSVSNVFADVTPLMPSVNAALRTAEPDAAVVVSPLS